MTHILISREFVVKFFKRYEAFILPLVKFLLALFVFTNILSIGYVHEALEPLMAEFSAFLLGLLFALLFTIMPTNMGWLLIILTLTVQFSANIEVAISIFLFLIFIFLFYARMAQKESILILLTILAFQFNVPYIVPLIVGLYLPITAIIPVTFGIFVNAQIPIVTGHVAPASIAGGIGEMEISDILTELPEAITVVYDTLMRSISGASDWVFIAVVFAMVIVLVHFVSRLAIDYAKDIAIALGCVMNIFGFIVAILTVDGSANIGAVIGFTILCGILAWVVRFFDGVLDYQRAESVVFEDDNNYYHVRIAPKVVMTRTQRVVKRIRPQVAKAEPLHEPGPEPLYEPEPEMPEENYQAELFYEKPSAEDAQQWHMEDFNDEQQES